MPPERHGCGHVREQGGVELRPKNLATLKVAVKEATVVANARQCAMMRVTHDAEYQELHEIVEYLNEK